MTRTMLFRAFDLLPICPDLIHVFDFEISENMWMASHQFIREMTDHFIKIKSAAFLPELSVEDHLQLQITQCFHHFMIIAGFDRIDKLIDLFHGVPAQGFMILLAIPWAT